MTQDEQDPGGTAGPGDAPGGQALEEFGAAYWEDRYGSGQGVSKHDPSPSLVAETAGLAPGRALDAGCGVGGDALWLAARGWQVTAVDIAPAALEQGRRTAEAAGPACAERIDWLHGDLTAWDPGGRRFDLVSSHYVHAPGPPELLLRRLASWVAPGGALLVVGHDGGHGHGDRQGQGHAHPPGAQLRAEQVVAVLPEDAWEVLVAESRTHTVRRPGGGSTTLDDVVVHARRRPGSHG